MRDIIPFLIPLTIFMIPIIAILTSHQRKMAELMHGSQHKVLPSADVEALRREMQELKEIVHQQTIAIDTISRRALPSDTENNRLSGV